MCVLQRESVDENVLEADGGVGALLKMIDFLCCEIHFRTEDDVAFFFFFWKIKRMTCSFKE